MGLNMSESKTHKDENKWQNLNWTSSKYVRTHMQQNNNIVLGERTYSSTEAANTQDESESSFKARK